MKSRVLVAACVLALLSGCASDPVTRYYVLSAVAPAQAAGANPVSVVIKDVRLPNIWIGCRS